MAHRPLQGEDFLVPIEGARGLCCVISWDEQSGVLSILTQETALEETEALVQSQGYFLLPASTSAAERQLFSGVFPVQSGEGSTLFSRRAGPLFPPMAGSFERCHYGYRYVGADGMEAFTAWRGAASAPAVSKHCFSRGGGGAGRDHRRGRMQRLWMVSDGGILPLTSQDLPGNRPWLQRRRAAGEQRTCWKASSSPSATRTAFGEFWIGRAGRMCVPCDYDAIGGYMGRGAVCLYGGGGSLGAVGSAAHAHAVV